MPYYAGVASRVGGVCATARSHTLCARADPISEATCPFLKLLAMHLVVLYRLRGVGGLGWEEYVRGGLEA